MRRLFALFIFFWCVHASSLEITVIEGVDNPTPIAVVPIGWNGSPLAEDISSIITADLRRSGFFRPIPPEDMLSSPSREQEVFYRDWRALDAQYLVIGQMEQNAEGLYRLVFELYDVLGQRKVFRQTVSGSDAQLRDMAHAVSDEVYEEITGIRGIFSTRIAYVEQLSQTQYRLMMADADGARPRMLLESTEPLLSPVWSPDGQWIAYVSYETDRPAIYIQEIATGQRQQLTNYRGLNGAPAWSPDGQKLAITLSKDGNPEIYVLDIESRRLTRVTRHFAIDTEPNWSKDGKAIIFTTDRGGNPQIYQVTLASGREERLTFVGDYNARARVSPDGKTLVFVHRRNGIFHIAAQDIASGDVRVLTETDLDESPSIAPNGAMLMYATKVGGKGVLAAVSIDRGSKYRLPSKQGDVREPAWSPYVN